MVWKVLGRLNKLCVTAMSAQSSESNTVPGASNTPTICHVPPRRRMVLPNSKPENSRNRPAPTTISLVPGRNMRPCVMCAARRSDKPSGPMPRNGMLALVLVERLRPSTITSNSPETTGCPSRCATPGPCARILSWSRDTTLLSSAPAPSRNTIATSSEPEPATVLLRPFDNAKKNSSTLMVSATATTLASDIAPRCGIERTLSAVTAPIWLSKEAMIGCP